MAAFNDTYRQAVMRRLGDSGSTPTQRTSEHDLNQINLQMRQQPWYQQWFAANGLNPNRVKLNDRQRQELTALAGRNGMRLGDRMKVDEAGNINQRGGFAGMPTWAKVAIGAAPVAASMLIPGVREATVSQLGSIFGAGGGGGATGGGAVESATGAAGAAGTFGTGVYTVPTVARPQPVAAVSSACCDKGVTSSTA